MPSVFTLGCTLCWDRPSAHSGAGVDTSFVDLVPGCMVPLSLSLCISEIDQPELAKTWVLYRNNLYVKQNLHVCNPL